MLFRSNSSSDKHCRVCEILHRSAYAIKSHTLDDCNALKEMIVDREAKRKRDPGTAEKANNPRARSDFKRSRTSHPKGVDAAQAHVASAAGTATLEEGNGQWPV